MTDSVADRLDFARTTGVCVRLETRDGDEYMTGVHEVDPAAGIVSLYETQTFGDEAGHTEIPLEEVASVAVTDVRWRA